MSVSNGQEQLNTEALVTSTQAITIIREHVDECREQNRIAHEERVAVRKAIDDLRDTTRESNVRLHERLDKTNGEIEKRDKENMQQRNLVIRGGLLALVGFLISVVTYLITNGVPWVENSNGWMPR